jgi:heterodisulfide reductase subunit A-like polyferredoxin
VVGVPRIVFGDRRQDVVVEPELVVVHVRRVCATVCDAKAIDHGQQDRHEEIQVGSIIVSTWFQPVEAAKALQYSDGG